MTYVTIEKRNLKMKTIHDQKIIQNYINQYHIKQYFIKNDASFSLKKYKKGELILQPMMPVHQFYFIVEGSIHIYAIHQNGSMYTLTIDDDLIILGDLEYINHTPSQYFVEARCDVTALCLEMDEKYRNDCLFLQCLLTSLSTKLIQASHFQADYTTLEEKVIAYIKYYCDQQILTHIEKTAMNLHCSKRQLLRILARMCQEGKMNKLKKGTYQLL